ncbi:MAG: OmpA family protein [Elusimicrobiota bacterium]|jgi:outer membrane protein OmpA-like peptidoglycan-associated protein|nr:OmpA family protein [Elusimicrobiota bacterium]
MKKVILSAAIVFAVTTLNAAWNQECFYGKCCNDGIVCKKCAEESRLENICHKKCKAIKIKGNAFKSCKKHCIVNKGNIAPKVAPVPKPVPAALPAPVVKHVERAKPAPVVAAEPKMEVGKTLTVAGTNFASNSSEITPAFSKYLKGKADELKKLDYNKLSVTGYSDSTGKPDYNVWLSEQRAKAVRDVFVKEGVPAEKIVYSGKGAANPIADNKTKEGRATNRRVEIAVK